MKIIFFSLLLVSGIFSATGQVQEPPATVPYVDLQKYAGLWYEIAKIPNSFQDHCKYGTTAEYIIDEEGDIKVINRCYEEDGELDMVEGVANIVEEATNAKLEVSFVSFFGIRPFWGDYWIITLDEDYNYVIIGHPERKYGWILARKPTLPDDTLIYLFKQLQKAGYDTSKFEMTDHKD